MNLPPVVPAEEWQAAWEALLVKEKEATRARDALAAELDAYRKRMSWTIPWVSSYASDFNVDFGVGPETPKEGVYQDGETFGLSVFLRAGEDVYRTYFTTARGVEALGSVWTFLDLTPLGRQEAWEDSPEGYPQTKPYEWWRRHDEYEDD